MGPDWTSPWMLCTTAAANALAAENNARKPSARTAWPSAPLNVFFMRAVKNGDRPLFFPILAVAAQRQNGAKRATRSASPTLPSPSARHLLTFQTGSPDMSEATVLFADVSGRTRLIETERDAVALNAIAR